MRKNVQNKIKLLILISSLLLVANPPCLMGEVANENIKIELTYYSETKSILLSVINKGTYSIEIFNPDLKTKDPINTPATLEVRMKNKNNEILGKNVFGVDEDGFMSNEIFDSRLFALPLPSVTMEAGEAFQLKTSFDRLIRGYKHKNYICQTTPIPIVAQNYYAINTHLSAQNKQQLEILFFHATHPIRPRTTICNIAPGVKITMPFQLPKML